jgi:hypothetical protein
MGARGLRKETSRRVFGGDLEVQGRTCGTLGEGDRRNSAVGMGKGGTPGDDRRLVIHHRARGRRPLKRAGEGEAWLVNIERLWVVNIG